LARATDVIAVYYIGWACNRCSILYCGCLFSQYYIG